MFIRDFSCFILSCFCFTNIYSQETISATGGNVKGTTGTVSFTIGQSGYNSYTGPNGYLIQGVQQPYEISVITSVKKDNNVSLECVVYPNLSPDFVKLKVKNHEAGKYSYQLFDINGNLLTELGITGDETGINISRFASEIYLLKIFLDKKIIKTFKLIKIK